ncbi:MULTISPECIES: hypothetical protein [Halomonas]|uniref:hypothetical protein n=1 Tax=Halomonas TaxID=2745 RepID=UPI000EEFE266|nr:MULTISPECIES: hypothetical protein [Halomonas]HCR96193.1 hypothetical protein [Halomonas sp.]
MNAITTQAPVVSLAALITLLDIEGLTICTQRLMLDDKATPDSVIATSTHRTDRRLLLYRRTC